MMRFRTIDVFRGIAAVMVIFFHMQHLSILSGNAFIAKSDTFVDFFFVLSGFVMTHSNLKKIDDLASARQFVVKRFYRIYPLHLFTLLLMLGFESFRYVVDRFFVPLTNPVFEKNNLLSFLANLTLTQALGLFDSVTWNDPSWSISAEFYVYILWALSLLVFRKNLVALCGTYLALVAWFIAAHGGNIIYNYDYGFIRCLYGFLVGVLTYRVHQNLVPPAGFRFNSVLEGAVAALTLVFLYSFTHPTSWLMPLWFAVVILVFSREAGAVSGVLSRPRFEFLGNLSYSYYLNHFIVLAAMDLFLFKVLKLPHTAWGEWVYLLVCLTLIHGMSVFTYRYVELRFQSKPHSKIKNRPAVASV
ncbi:acyltransferase family protein [Larkinella soli]|uniref:acyltransferase family protein n=1 Tax=Larkinella soli TaxID=1770527 RepID=UPI001E482E5C|nr:acyltransferase [Larkinella soli]